MFVFLFMSIKSKMLISAVVIASVGVIANCSARTKSYEPKALDKAVDNVFMKCLEKGYEKSNCYSMSFFKKWTCEKAVEKSCGKLVEEGTDKAIKEVFGDDQEALKKSENSAKLDKVLSVINKIQ